MKQNYELTGSDYTNQLVSGNVDWVVKPSFFVNAHRRLDDVQHDAAGELRDGGTDRASYG